MKQLMHARLGEGRAIERPRRLTACGQRGGVVAVVGRGTAGQVFSGPRPVANRAKRQETRTRPDCERSRDVQAGEGAAGEEGAPHAQQLKFAESRAAGDGGEGRPRRMHEARPGNERTGDSRCPCATQHANIQHAKRDTAHPRRPQLGTTCIAFRDVRARSQESGSRPCPAPPLLNQGRARPLLSSAGGTGDSPPRMEGSRGHSPGSTVTRRRLRARSERRSPSPPPVPVGEGVAVRRHGSTWRLEASARRRWRAVATMVFPAPSVNESALNTIVDM